MQQEHSENGTFCSIKVLMLHPAVTATKMQKGRTVLIGPALDSLGCHFSIEEVCHWLPENRFREEKED